LETSRLLPRPLDVRGCVDVCSPEVDAADPVPLVVTLAMAQEAQIPPL
jgi:hypothetical protein